MAAINSDDAEAAFLNAMKVLQELESTQNDMGSENDKGARGRAESLGAQEILEGVSESEDGTRGLSPHDDEEEEEQEEQEEEEEEEEEMEQVGEAEEDQEQEEEGEGEEDQEQAEEQEQDEDIHMKTPALEEVSPVASLLPATVSSPKTGSSSVGASANEKDTTTLHHDHSTVDISATTQDSSARSSAAPTRADSATVDDGAYVPDENISDQTPPPMFIDTNQNTGSHNVDSLPVSASVASPPVSTLTTTTAPALAVPAQNSVQKTATPVSNKRRRLPQDIVGQLEDRIKEDPRGDIDAWLALIEEHRKKGKLDDARAAYERFFVVFPAAAQQWIAYVKMELANNELIRVEQIFFRSLLNVPNVELWSLYLDYIRRRNNLTTDTGGKARAIVSQAYEFVLNSVGCDREAGKIWGDHVQFVKSGPGNVGGSGWQDQQKMDSLRKVYQKAVTMPVQGVEQLWREYDQFEQGLNKLTARKFLQERSPLFMTARSCLIELTNTTKGLRRETLPRLPPAPGYEGYEDWTKQVELWKKWIQWEKDDPLVLAKDDPAGLKTRILYVFKQALMALRFWPEIWFDAAEWCFANGMDDQGVEFLKQGMVANPESCLLHFKYAERLEATISVEGGEEALVRKGQMIRKPYDDLLNVLYTQVSKAQQREKEEIAKLEEGYQDPQGGRDDDDYDDPDIMADKSAKESQITAIKESTKAQIQVMSGTISAVWINLMRAMRRVQGHGKVNEPLGGSRQIFADARKRGKITSDVYVASALIEFHCYKDPAALKIFERGMKLFPEDEEFALEYLKHLIADNDITNARAVFETFVGKAPAQNTKKIYQYFYEYEAHYGDLNQVYKLEKRMSELFPGDPYLNRFSTRYSYKSVDPCSYIPVISSSQQCRPKSSGRQEMMQDYNQTDNRQQIQVAIPNGRVGAGIASPKRPANEDLSDSSEHRPRKVLRPDSPLKGAAGRRLDQQKRVQQQQQQQQQQQLQQQQQQQHNRERGNLPDRDAVRDDARGSYQRQQHQGRPQQQQQQQQPMHQQPPPPPPAPALPEMLMYLLSILPGAQQYQAVRFRPEAMMGLLASLNIPRDAQGSQSYSYPR